MITPLVLLQNKIPQECIDLIQKYVSCSIAEEAANKSYDIIINNIHQRNNLYRDFVWDNYVYPNCFCNNCPDNGRHKLFKKRDCDHCFIFESTMTYYTEEFMEKIWNENIPYDNSSEYSNEDYEYLEYEEYYEQDYDY